MISSAEDLADVDIVAAVFKKPVGLAEVLVVYYGEKSPKRTGQHRAPLVAAEIVNAGLRRATPRAGAEGYGWNADDIAAFAGIILLGRNVVA